DQLGFTADVIEPDVPAATGHQGAVRLLDLGEDAIEIGALETILERGRKETIERDGDHREEPRSDEDVPAGRGGAGERGQVARIGLRPPHRGAGASGANATAISRRWPGRRPRRSSRRS